jgi:type II secretory pathway pseudopilin PulG
MTLIEVLAVVCIIALAAALTLAGLGAANADAQVRAALAQCRQLDARSRLLARADGPVVISVAEDLLCADHAGADEVAAPMLRVLPPDDWAFHLLDAQGNALPQLLVDARGCSDDYTIALRSGKVGEGPSDSRRLRIAGLTGWIEEAPEP